MPCKYVFNPMTYYVRIFGAKYQVLIEVRYELMSGVFSDDYNDHERQGYFPIDHTFVEVYDLQLGQCVDIKKQSLEWRNLLFDNPPIIEPLSIESFSYDELPQYNDKLRAKMIRGKEWRSKMTVVLRKKKEEQKKREEEIKKNVWLQYRNYGKWRSENGIIHLLPPSLDLLKPEEREENEWFQYKRDGRWRDADGVINYTEPDPLKDKIRKTI